MTEKAEGLLGLHAGSRMPADADEVDELLRRVPDVAFAPELASCLFAASDVAPSTPLDAPVFVARLADEAYVARLRKGLEALRARAHREGNGGMEFLATTLGHFADRMPPDRHPLVVALWCRSVARRLGQPDVSPAVAVAMDVFESSRGSET
jgi:hypothetical protein